MKPKNNKARRNSFIKFLLLFVFTVAVIIGAIFFTFKMPDVENSILKSQSSMFKEDLKFQNAFSKDIQKTKSLIDSLDVPGVNASFLNSLINDKLAKTQSSVQDQIAETKNKSKYDHEMYFQLINLLAESQKMKSKLIELEDAETTIEEYKEAIDEAKQSVEGLERDLIICRSR